jgi:hypothetical protein
VVEDEKPIEIADNTRLAAWIERCASELLDRWIMGVIEALEWNT